jgi:peptidoglycan/xylan/chitin deacetylase (PgdA/CDA1 family)
MSAPSVCYSMSAPPHCAKQVMYTLLVLMDGLGASNRSSATPAEMGKCDHILVSYGTLASQPRPSAQIHFNASDFFGAAYLQPGSLPEPPLDALLLSNGDTMPLLYVANGDLPGEVICRSERGLPLASLIYSDHGYKITSNADLIASSFYMLSRYEEVVAPARDRFDRFPATASLAVRAGFLDRPIVNQMMLLLREWINRVLDDRNLPELPSCLYPEGKAFAVSLSHDVDRVRRHPRQAITALLRDSKARRVGTGLARFTRAMRDVLAKRDLYWTIQTLLEEEEKHGIKSAFYFTTGHHAFHDPFYALSEPGIRSAVSDIQAVGNEIGLHGSFDSFSDARMLRQQRKQLEAIIGNSVAGVRQHYLRFQVPTTWRTQVESGLRYDTTMGYADYPGFRAGFCFPFRPFDLLENRTLDLWELPLIVMDGTLYQYRSYSTEEAFQVLLRFVETVKRYHGVFTFLWHSSMSDPDDSGTSAFPTLYPRLLTTLRDLDAFCCTPVELIDWWHRRSHHKPGRDDV